MPDADSILTAEQVLALFRNEDIGWMEVAARLEQSHERLREQRDKGMEREADFIKKWADAEDRLARVTNEAKRQFEEWAEHLRACSDQCAKAEEKVARVTAALDWYADHKTDQGRYDGELWGDLNALAAVEEPAEEPRRARACVCCTPYKPLDECPNR